MKKRITFISQLSLSLLLFSCTVKPVKIDYGNEACHSCRMTIVDQLHASQLVTTKGKVYNFDAAECMISYLPEIGEEKLGFILVTNYTTPTELIDAKTAAYIISEDIPSPMGANLSASESISSAEKILQNKKGTIYSWSELLNVLNKSNQ